MATQEYELRISVKLPPGTDRQRAHSGFGKLFKMDAAKVATVFAAGRNAVKRELDHATALKCQKALAQYGISCEIVPSTLPETPVSADVSDAGSAEPPAPTDTSPPVGEPAPMAEAPPAAPPSPPAASATDFEPDTSRTLALQFHGKGGEFFRIWIVNLVLSILTLGIYSAWAKVRERQYLYGNTELDGQRFSYLASPIAILKGRLVAFALIAVYVALSKFVPGSGAVLGLLIVLLMPLLVVQALRFNLRMSAYRHVRFGFDGTVGNAYLSFIGWPILALLSLLLLLPLAICKQKSFLANGYRFGTQRFQATLSTKAFYAIYLRSLGIGLIGGLIAALLVGLLPIVAGIVSFALYTVVSSYMIVRQLNLVRNATHVGPHRFASNYEIRSWMKLQIVNLLGIALSLGLLIPWAKIRSLHYNAAHFAVIAQGDLDGFTAKEQERVSALGEEIGNAFDVIDIGI